MKGSLIIKLSANLSAAAAAFGVLSVRTKTVTLHAYRFGLGSGRLEVITRLAAKERLRQMGMK